MEQSIRSQIWRLIRTIQELDQDELFDIQIEEKTNQIMEIFEEDRDQYIELLIESNKGLRILDSEYQYGWDQLIEKINNLLSKKYE